MEHVQHILKAATKHVFDVEVEPLVEVAEAEHGDFASNVAFVLSGQLKQAPKAIAEQLAEAIKDPLVESAAAAGAGFINLKMTDKYWVDELAKVKAGYGHSTGKGQKVQVEFISANPTGPLTLGNARGGFLGDVIGNVLKTQGHDVTKEYYFNDAGTQIGQLVKAARSAAGEKVEGEVQYKGEYLKDVMAKLGDISKLNDAELAQLLTDIIFTAYIRPAIEGMGITFDVFTNEKHLAADFAAIREFLNKKKLVEEKEGAVWLKSESFGDERDRVLVKSNGDVTYLGNDIAYHRDIFENRHFERSIKVWGADHAGQVPSLKLTINELFPGKELDFVIIQWVRLMREGQEVKMSKRAGTFVTVDELIEEVGSDVARFFFLMRSPDTQMDFDLDLAKEQSQKNPLLYVMYSYARAHSILAKAKEKKLVVGSSLDSLSAQERALVRKLAEWPSLLQQMAGDYGVHRLTFYGQDLAKLFHDFYEAEKIIDLPAKQAEAKLYLVERFITFMDGYFNVLGVTPQQRMDHEHE